MNQKESTELIKRSAETRKKLAAAQRKSNTVDEQNACLLVRASLNDIDTLIASPHKKASFEKISGLLTESIDTLEEMERHFNQTC